MIEKMSLAPQSFALSDQRMKDQKKTGAVDLSKQFSNYLNEAINKVNDQSVEVNGLTEQFATGNLEDVHKLMIANEKSLIQLELTVQVRNKVIEAYQEIMRTQI